MGRQPATLLRPTQPRLRRPGAAPKAKPRREIIRCLERHIARENYRLLTDPPAVPHGADLRQQRRQARIGTVSV